MEFYFKEYPFKTGEAKSIRIVDNLSNYYGTCGDDGIVIKGLQQTKEHLKAIEKMAIKKGDVKTVERVRKSLDSGLIKVENLEGTVAFDHLKDYVLGKYILPCGNKLPFMTESVTPSNVISRADPETRMEMLNKNVSNLKGTEIEKLIEGYYIIQKAGNEVFKQIGLSKSDALESCEKHLKFFGIVVKDTPDASLDHNQLPESKPSTDEDVHRPKKIHGISAADITYFQRPESETKPSVNKSIPELMDAMLSGEITREDFLKLLKEALDEVGKEKTRETERVLGREPEPEITRKTLDPEDIRKEWQEKADRNQMITPLDVQKGLMSKLITPVQSQQLLKAIESDNRAELMKQFRPPNIAWEDIWKEQDLSIRRDKLKQFEANLRHQKREALEKFLRGG